MASPSNYPPVATMRLALVASMPSVTLAIMPGFNSATVAFCPFTMISVKELMPRVFVVFPSLATRDRVRGHAGNNRVTIRCRRGFLLGTGEGRIKRQRSTNDGDIGNK